MDSQAPAHPLPTHFRHWDPAAAALIAAVLFIPLPAAIRPGPGWLPAVVVAALLMPITVMQEAIRRPGGWQPSPRLVRKLALAMLGLLALSEAVALALLLSQLSQVKGPSLFRSAALIWTINLLVFSLAYWELDDGGPARRLRGPYRPVDFLFPQQTDPHLAIGWIPEFLDYVFLAFNTGTAFSPTDTMILSRPAKGAMMAQATIALLTLGLVVARGVNII